MAEGDDAGQAPPELQRLRCNIDDVDAVLVKLLNQRARWAVEIARVKKQHGLAVYQPEREAQVLGRVQEISPGPLPDGAVRRVFERIVDESRSLQQHLDAEACRRRQAAEESE